MSIDIASQLMHRQATLITCTGMRSSPLLDQFPYERDSRMVGHRPVLPRAGRNQHPGRGRLCRCFSSRRRHGPSFGALFGSYFPHTPWCTEIESHPGGYWRHKKERPARRCRSHLELQFECQLKLASGSEIAVRKSRAGDRPKCRGANGKVGVT
jgi:hypothetical protein